MIKLRELKESDLEFLLEVRNHTTTRQFLANTSLFTLEQSREWYKNLTEQYYIIENEDGERVGYFRTNGDEVGCDIHMDFRRKGYARQAYEEYLKDRDYATLYVLETNFAKKLYESLGFKETGKFIIHDDRGKHLEMIWKR
jgi:ribosomal protein S18 acetylase RimI-like enzyme